MEKTYLKLEDVYTTGILAEELGIKRINIADFANKKVNFHKTGFCALSKLISMHMVAYHEQFELWKKILDGRTKCKIIYTSAKTAATTKGAGAAPPAPQQHPTPDNNKNSHSDNSQSSNSNLSSNVNNSNNLVNSSSLNNSSNLSNASISNQTAAAATVTAPQSFNSSNSPVSSNSLITSSSNVGMGGGSEQMTDQSEMASSDQPKKKWHLLERFTHYIFNSLYSTFYNQQEEQVRRNRTRDSKYFKPVNQIVLEKELDDED